MSTTLPLNALEALCVAWADHRGLWGNTTPAAQLGKTAEEIAEATDALEVWQGTGNADAHHALALELGDVLVTLALQCHLQGAIMIECRRKATPTPTQDTWERAGYWLKELELAISSGSKDETISAIGHLIECVADAARVHLAMSLEECLALALAKISSRSGAVVDGVFVKA